MHVERDQVGFRQFEIDLRTLEAVSVVYSSGDKMLTNDPYLQDYPLRSLSWSQLCLLAEAYHPDFVVPEGYARYR